MFLFRLFCIACGALRQAANLCVDGSKYKINNKIIYVDLPPCHAIGRQKEDFGILSISIDNILALH